MTGACSITALDPDRPRAPSGKYFWLLLARKRGHLGSKKGYTYFFPPLFITNQLFTENQKRGGKSGFYLFLSKQIFTRDIELKSTKSFFFQTEEISRDL
jgi:hypothetical protein